MYFIILFLMILLPNFPLSAMEKIEAISSHSSDGTEYSYKHLKSDLELKFDILILTLELDICEIPLKFSTETTKKFPEDIIANLKSIQANVKSFTKYFPADCEANTYLLSSSLNHLINQRNKQITELNDFNLKQITTMVGNFNIQE